MRPAPPQAPPAGTLGYMGKPANPRNFQVSGNTISWSAPVDARGIVGYRVYLDSETNLINTVQTVVGKAKGNANAVNSINLKLAPGTNHVVFISSITGQGRESNKLPVNISGAQLGQATGVTANPTTQSNALVPIPDMTFTINATGHNVLILFSADVTLTGSGSLGANALFQIYKDGAALSQIIKGTTPVNGLYAAVSISFMDLNVTGSHTYAAYWSVTGGGPPITAQLDGTNRSLQVVEIA